ncbi:hypothetical protein [Polyangium sorediatum]|uniref:RING-type E3 ubiquitin transferase n=1 Tax=Polyangium sorediatum TaxID=889274 RepID=A0ABT6NNN4_9BACT|nr:hypothetical protein [Polyangium sorediatum]MDI1429800.1 hypothetical protein [Polyangium sorediatum]
MIVTLLGAGLVVAGGALVFRAREGAALVLEVWRRPTKRIAEIEPGVVELAGRISAAEEPIDGLSQKGCVAVRTHIRGFSGEGKRRERLGERSVLRASRAALRDESGTCVVDLGDAEVVGDEWVSHAVRVEEVASSWPPWARDLVPPGATHVEVEEAVVPEGADVMITAVTRKQERVEGFYRDARARWELGGSEEMRGLVTVGGQVQLFRRTGGAVAFAVVCGVFLVVQGIATILAGIEL